MSTPLTEHFTLEELLRPHTPLASVPQDVRENLERLALDILEPVRVAFDLPVVVSSGYRPYAYNIAIGGAKASDHVFGRAADFRVADGPHPWETNTLNAFHLIRTNLVGRFGQLILEDHRIVLANPGKLWVHVAIPSAKHPGDGTDSAAMLFSPAPNVYEPWGGQA